MRNIAWFYWLFREDIDQARQFARTALEINPSDVSELQILGVISQQEGRSEEAESFFSQALDLQPENADCAANWSYFLLSVGRRQDAERAARGAWSLNAGRSTQAAAECALYLGLLARMDRKDDSPALARLKGLFAKG